MFPKVVRCKFTCTSKREYRGWCNGQINVPQFEYEFAVVTGTGASDEDKRFFAATPSGSLKLSTVLDGSFEVGQTYFVDLQQAPA